MFSEYVLKRQTPVDPQSTTSLRGVLAKAGGPTQRFPEDESASLAPVGLGHGQLGHPP